MSDIMEKLQRELQTGMRDTIVSWCGEQGFFPTDEQIAILLAKLTDAQVGMAQKVVNNTMNTLANKDLVIEKVNEYWPDVEKYIRLAQAFLVRPLQKCDPKDIIVKFSQAQEEKGEDE